GEQFEHFCGRLQVALGVGEPPVAEFRDGAAVPYGGQDVVKRPAARDVVVRVVGGDEWHAGLAGEVRHLPQPPPVLRAAVQLRHGVTTVAEQFAVAGEVVQGRNTRVYVSRS